MDTSYTAGKNGLLTKNLIVWEGKSFGITTLWFINGRLCGRAKTPDSGPKLGEWNISREEIVSQLSSQGLQLPPSWMDHHRNAGRYTK